MFSQGWSLKEISSWEETPLHLSGILEVKIIISWFSSAEEMRFAVLPEDGVLDSALSRSEKWSHLD